MKKSKIGVGLIGIGSLLFVARSVAPGLFFTGPLEMLTAIPGGAATFVWFGILLYAYDRYGLSLSRSSGTTPGLQRQDVIASTNWSRENKHQIRKLFGVGLATAGVLAWALSSVLGVGGLKLLWLLVAAVGVGMIVLSWRLARGIKADHTREVSVRLPDQIALHTFHVRLRQLVEDRGYAVVSDTSPSEGGRSAAFADGVWLSHGSFKARRRPVSESRTLVPEVENDPYLSKLLTAITVGFVGILGGISLTQVRPAPTAADPNMALYDGAHLLGWLFVLGGVGLVAYGYVRRTREWAEIYCVEEGTVYGSNVNLYDEATRADFDGHATPNVSAPDTACEIVVTLGGTCTSLYDERQLESDLQSLAEAVQGVARDQRHEFFEDEADLSPGDIERPTEPSSRSVSE
ncbi:MULTISPECIES: hypothetical protein [Halorussus]|uniref:hypothetical protein n=1 Tax=Halorussus TaxID=1070314 RepID=UPI000E20D4AA|nr:MULTISPECIES: hypothetical protein [Halorussus]NHN58886.1 hypothetical protein [Halorussus sp. JP-T4]